MTNDQAKTLKSKIWPAVVMVGSLGIWANGNAVTAFAQDQAPAAQDASGAPTDGKIEMDVVHALDAAPELKQDWITAGTVQGQVTLSGTTASDANKQLAATIAGKVPGVTNVVNNLKVGDPQAAAQENNAQPQDQVDYSDQGRPTAGNNGNMQQPVPPPPPPDQANNQGSNQNYPTQNYPNQGYPQGPARPRVPEQPLEPVTLQPGTLLKVRTSEPLNSKMAKVGTPVEFTVVRDVYAGGVLAIPRGATIRGEVVDQKNAGTLGGSAELGLKIENLDLGGKSYALDSTPFEVKGPNKAGRTVGNAIGGALFGAIIGGAVGGGGGAAIGAAAGGVGGTAASAATPGPRVWIPAEALMDFHLNTPVTVTPVSRWEAQRLASNAPPPSQRPTLYRRGYYPYGYPPPPPPPPGYYGGPY